MTGFEEYEILELLNTDETIAKEQIEKYKYPWEVVPHIEEIILEIGSTLGDDYEEVKENVWIHKEAKIFDSAYIDGPAIICKGATVRQCAFIRGKAIVGENSVVGNSTELKNVILFNNVQVPHYNYIGDSILGYKAHFGAGSITSNVKSDRTNVLIKNGVYHVETMLRKLGAIVGDNVEIGCNSVLNPGTIIGRNTNIYPLNSVRGTIKANSIYKNKDEIIEKRMD